MRTFIEDTSIVKKIWSTTDITLFIFAGASAEFALNKQVDWLYFTGKIPGDPIGRLFSTVKYAQYIIFNEEKEAISSIEKINTIHHHVESARGEKITNAGYQDVLFMLIYYSISSFELLERKLTIDEKNDVVRTFKRIGEKMHIQGLPGNYAAWIAIYDQHLRDNLANSSFTKDLFRQYRKHLGLLRYFLLIDIQRMLVSRHVSKLLNLKRPRIVHLLIPVYRHFRKYAFHKRLIVSMVPDKFKNDIRMMGIN